MGGCCSCRRNRRPLNDEREPLLPKYAPKVAAQTQFDRVTDIIAAASVGKLPSQAQINGALQLLLRSEFLRTEAPAAQQPLSARGRQILDDLRETVEAVQVLGVQKNDDDRIQDMLYQMSRLPEVPVSVDLSADVDVTSGLEAGVSQLRSDPPFTTEEAQQDAAQILTSLRELIYLLFTSNAFRLIVSDALLMWQETVADTAAEVAQVATAVDILVGRPDEIIRTESEEHGRDRNAGETRVPALDDLTQSGESAREQAPRAVKETTTKTNKRKDHISDNIHCDNPESVKTRVLDRVQQIIEQAQTDPRFSAVLSRLCSIAQKYVEKAKGVAIILNNSASVATCDIHSPIKAASVIDMDPHLSAALENVRVILERFSGHNLDLLLTKVSRVVSDIGDASETGLPAWLNATSAWVDQSLRHPGWLGTEEGREEGGRLYDWVVRLFTEDPTLKADGRGILDEVHAIISGLKDDRAISRAALATRRLEEHVANFGAAVAGDMLMREWPRLKQELWNDVFRWLLPRILRVISVIPLPRVELKSDALDLVFDRLTLSSPSFIPDHIRITNYSDVLLDASDATSDGSYEFTSSTRSKIAIDGLRISVQDIAYYMNAKGPVYTGWLDSGLLTIDVGQQGTSGGGIKIAVDLEFASQKLSHTDNVDLFKVLEVKVDVPGLKFILNDTRHWIFNKVILQPLAGPIIRRLLSFVLSAQIRNYLETLNRSLARIRDTATTHADGASPSLQDYLIALLTQGQAGGRSGGFRRSRTPSPSSSRFRGRGSDHSSESRNEEEGAADTIKTRTHIEPTAKGIIRTSITETVDGDPINETSIAVGIGEQILPGVGGPNEELTPTLVDEARRAMDEVDHLREQVGRGATEVKTEINKTRDIVQQRMERAAVRLQKQREREGRKGGWRSDAFDL